jgi:NADH-quinone oxidoreductase subunit N
MSENPVDVLPELLALGAAVLGLLTGMFTPRDRQRIVAWICAAGLAAALAATAAAATRPDGMAFDAFALDARTHAARAAVYGATLLVIPLAAVRARGHAREAEVYVLMLLAALGTVVLAAAGDLLVFAAAYLLASIPAYALAGFAKDGPGTEAALKYYLMGAFLGILMLAGVTLLYGLAGATDYQSLGARLPGVPGATAGCAVIALLAGVLFKAGAVPAHFWVPDVAEGAPPAVAAFVTTVPKIGAFAGLFRMAAEFFAASAADWRPLLAVIATATMTLGNLAAFYQDRVRRLLAYSTISQAGYLLVPVVVAGRGDLPRTALLFYVAAYAVTNAGAFAVVVACRGESLGDYAGLARRAPAVAAALAVCLFGLIGTPPTAVFVGKLLVFAAAWDGGYAWLAVVAVINTVASVFYYLRWIVPVFRPGDPGPGPRPDGARFVAYAAAVISIVMGVASGAVLTVA